MKATGIVRKIDELGRVVLPIELRRTLDIGERDGVEIFVQGDQIILRKYAPGCTLCGGMENLVQHPTGKVVCEHCLKVTPTKLRS